MRSLQKSHDDDDHVTRALTQQETPTGRLEPVGGAARAAPYPNHCSAAGPDSGPKLRLRVRGRYDPDAQ